MILEGNIRKMKVWLDGNHVQYGLRLYDNLEAREPISINEFVGKSFSIEYLHEINCVVSGKKINKTFGDGMSYEAFMNSPEASPSIIRPELSRIHEGIALRDFEWEVEHHLTPHIVYLAQTADVKVGVTRNTQIPTRWLDQGAIYTLKLAETPYRQAAGLIEVALKNYISDKTSWQKMLKGELERINLFELAENLKKYVPTEMQQYLLGNQNIDQFIYPILAYPPKVYSLKLDKTYLIDKKLMGIRGQYLLFDDGSVFNMRSHSGYKVRIEL